MISFDKMLSSNVSTIITKNVVIIDDVVIDENLANKFINELVNELINEILTLISNETT